MIPCEVCGYDQGNWKRCPSCLARAETYIPTPTEIETACLAIQAKWPKGTKRSRMATCYRTDLPVEITETHGGIASDKRRNLDCG